jgi:hypothetical protein
MFLLLIVHSGLCQLLPKAFRQGIYKNVFDGRSFSFVLPVHPSPAGGLTDVHPIGGFVTSTLELTLIHQCFHQDWVVAEAVEPIIRNCFDGHGKNRAGQIFNPDPGKNEEPTVVDNFLQVALSLFIAPTDPTVSGCHLPGRARKLQTPQSISTHSGFDEIAQLRTKG